MRFDVASRAPVGGIEPHVSLSFRDRYMMRDLGWLSAVDVNDGALYIALLITLVLHPETPRVVALDDVDLHLNPRLARRLIGRVQDILLDEPERPQLILTTHNPLILDALKLRDDRVRLFVTFRDSGGATVVRRVPHSQAIEKAEEHGMSLSQLWLSGALHGVPNL
jgi:predicted ATPase